MFGEQAFGLALVAILLLAGYVRGLTGFGLSAIFVGAMGFLSEPLTVVPVALSLEIVASLHHLGPAFRQVHKSHLALILATAVPGGAIGAAGLRTIPPEILLSCTFGVLLLASSLIAADIHLTHKKGGRPQMLAIGALAGVVNGATALGGLTLAAGLAQFSYDAFAARATVSVFLLVANVSTLAVVAVTGPVYSADPILYATSIPIASIGLVFGARAAEKVPQAQLRRGSMGLLAGLSALGLMQLIAGR